MSIKPAQRLQNVVASLEKYIQDTLVTTDGVAVAWPGVPFDSRDLASWVELYYLGKGDTARFGRVNGDDAGADVRLQVQFACFSRRRTAAGVPTNRAAHLILRDKVLGRFPLGGEITLTDYEGGTGPADVICVTEVNDTPLAPATGARSVVAGMDGSGQGLSAWMVTVVLRYIEPHGSTA